VRFATLIAGSQTQISVGCIICIVAALIFALTWPYVTFRDNVLGILSHCQIIGTLFSAMMYKVGEDASLAYEKKGTGWLLIVLNGGVFLIMLGWVGFEVMVEEGPGLRSREKQFLAQASFLFSGGSSRGKKRADTVLSNYNTNTPPKNIELAAFGNQVSRLGISTDSRSSESTTGTFFEGVNPLGGKAAPVFSVR